MMKPHKRKQLKQKINESIHEIIAKHDEKRKKNQERMKARYSPEGISPKALLLLKMKHKRLKIKDGP